MKVAVFEVSVYETETFAHADGRLELSLHTERLTKENAALTEGCEGVIILGMSILDESLLQILAKNGVRYISTRTVGFNHVDVKAANRLGIRVSNARYEPDNVADFAIMLMLMMLRKAKVSVCRALVNDFSLDGMCGREMHSLTIGICGAGKIGRKVMTSLSGFGCRILYYDPYVRETQLGNAHAASFDELLSASDIISLHMPLTEENYHILNTEAFAKMKVGTILINTARGGLVDNNALIEAIESGRLGGAAIDTIEDESQVFHTDLRARVIAQRDLFYLKQFPNVLYTPHYAFFTEEATVAMVKCALDSLICFEAGTRNPYEIIM